MGPPAGRDDPSSTIEAVVARFRSLVSSIGVRRGLHAADLDEVIQDVRIRLWRSAQAGKVLDELGSSYLYHVATTAALDVLRRRRAQATRYADEIDERDAPPARTPTPLEDAEGSELAERIDAALETLATDRRVAVRFHLSGYERDDIARMTGWSEGKTRNLLYRGLDDLRRRLAAMGVAPGERR